MISISEIFEIIKANVDLLSVVENTGIKVNRNRMCKCPFHLDKNPSMKINNKIYYCFGCQEKGDAVDFISKYYGLSLIDAAKKICSDFNLSYDNSCDKKELKDSMLAKKIEPKISNQEKYKKVEFRCFNVLCDYYYLLLYLKNKYAPKSDIDEGHPLFIEALQNISKIQYQLDTILFGDISDRVFLLSDCGKKVIALERRIKEFDYRAAGSY